MRPIYSQLLVFYSAKSGFYSTFLCVLQRLQAGAGYWEVDQDVFLSE